MLKNCFVVEGKVWIEFKISYSSINVVCLMYDYKKLKFVNKIM